MMQCPHCGAEIAEASRFCLSCMQPINQKQLIKSPRRRNPARVIVVALILVAAVAIPFLLWPESEPGIEPTAPQVTEPTEPIEPEETRPQVGVPVTGLADPVPGANYDLFNNSLQILDHAQPGRIDLEAARESLDALYRSGEMLAIPSGHSVGNIFVDIYDSGMDRTQSFAYTGYLTQKNRVGDYHAFKFRVTEGGIYDIGVELYYHNANNAGVLNAYLLPTTTPEADIAGMLTETYQVGSIRILQDLENRKIYADTFAEGYPLEADSEYMLIIQIAEDLYQPDNDRVDLMLAGLHIEKQQ